MKRQAEDLAGEPIPSKKGRLFGSDSASSRENDMTPEHALPDNASEDEDQDSHYAETLASTRLANTPLTPLSPAPKFPSDLKTIKCTHLGCDKTFNRPARLAAHLRSHNNDRPFKCTLSGCDKSYIEEKHLKQHVKGSHSTEREHTCQEPDCGKSFLTATRLRRHQAVHEGQERFRCREFPPCNQSFRKHQTLQRHIRSEHLHVSPFPCSSKDDQTGVSCQASFDNAGALKRHQEREHGQLRFWCDECGKRTDDDGSPIRTGFPTMTLLQAHMKQSHISCMFCGLVCNGRLDLDHHVESQHSKQSLEQRKTVSCNFDGCIKTFTKKSNLNAHIRSVHEGSRFVCGEVDLSSTGDISSWLQSEGCGESFVSKANLENHVRFVHLKFERPEAPVNPSGQSAATDHLNFIAELLGSESLSRHTVPCTYDSCPLKFRNALELQEHIAGQHPDVITQQKQTTTATQDQFSFLSHTASTEAMNWEDGLQDGQFWIGANDHTDFDGVANFSNSAFDDEWFKDEAEMRQLIGGGAVDELDGLIDPALGH